ncbi:MAG TPA: polysaccharide ABC transporter ATP-binding protein [Acidimicrobiales bacterium]|nr:polysaccharide ABC transporter ATP-binding protein [Acidimicrobiales bacterium]
MSDPVVRFEHVSKTYRGFVTESLGRRVYYRMRGGTLKKGRVQALKDVSFELEAGQSVALMGLNGSGKTTALSMIARISTPTSGQIKVRGRVGALLAVGTGLHGDLTGRENIEVYARILGYSSAEIRRKFDAIVDFAEISEALDRPLKFYSSGMQLRLGFSIAAHVEPEVMLVDEAVSVGDVLFQQRCLERMTELVQGGSALMLVSHQPEIVARTCREGMLLRDGQLVSHGSMDSIISEYLQETGKTISLGSEKIELLDWDISDVDFAARRARIVATVRTNEPVQDPRFGMTIADLQHGPLLSPSMILDDVTLGNADGTYTLICELEDIPLRAGIYRVVLFATTSRGGDLTMSPHVLGHITWGEPALEPVAVGKGGYGPVLAPARWKLDPHQ